MAEKVTDMLLKVDLNCYSCTKKLKKILCKFPQIRDTVYDEKNNTVKITVICCSPEKIRDKLCCRGGKVIKTIEILEASKPKPKEAEKKKEADNKPAAKEPEKPKQQKEPDQKPKESEKPKEKEAPKPKENGKPKESEKPKLPPAQEKPKEAAAPPAKPPQPAPVAMVPVPVAMMPPKQPEPIPNAPAPTMMAATACPMQYYSCGQCSGGPCHHGYGMPIAPPPCYDNYGNVYGYAYGQGGGGGGGGGGGYYGYNNNNQRCHLDRCCDYYFSEDNPSSCAIM